MKSAEMTNERAQYAVETIRAALDDVISRKISQTTFQCIVLKAVFPTELEKSDVVEANKRWKEIMGTDEWKQLSGNNTVLNPKSS